jgi:hypothetical protein
MSREAEGIGLYFDTSMRLEGTLWDVALILLL